LFISPGLRLRAAANIARLVSWPFWKAIPDYSAAIAVAAWGAALGNALRECEALVGKLAARGADERDRHFERRILGRRIEQGADIREIRPGPGRQPAQPLEAVLLVEIRDRHGPLIHFDRLGRKCWRLYATLRRKNDIKPQPRCVKPLDASTAAV
jgi:hypothetical protein